MRREVARELRYNDELTASQWALNSAVECHLHTVEVVGSNPTAPTIFSYSPLVNSQDPRSARRPFQGMLAAGLSLAGLIACQNLPTKS